VRTRAGTDAGSRVLVARLDNDGDVLLSGPAVRAVAAGGAAVTMLVGPRGRQAAGLLPGVADVLVWHCPWIDSDPQPVSRGGIDALVDTLAAADFAAALLLTSYHQSALPLALILRMAEVPRLGALSDDYPGSLLDVRHRLPDTGLHEAQRALSTAEALGFMLPPGDDGRLRVRGDLPELEDGLEALVGAGPYVVVHPGASVPARAWAPERCAQLVDALVAAGRRVVVTGAPGERALTARVAHEVGIDLGGRTDFAGLAAVLARADAVVVGNTGPAHLAAAVDAPVVSLFAPTVPAERWAPYTGHRVVLGDLTIPCAGCRARECPVPGHPCLSAVSVEDVVLAVDSLTDSEGATTAATASPSHQDMEVRS
jgi:ADP-heptose:LPS heptosyltransferase